MKVFLKMTKDRNMKHKKITLIMLCLVGLGLILGIVVYLNQNNTQSKVTDIRAYVIENQEELTSIAQREIDELQGTHELYDKQKEMKEVLDSYVYYELKPDKVEVLKAFDENQIYSFTVYLKIKPEDEEYYRCGIYYSPSDAIIDPYSNYHSGDTYEYDGRPNHDRCLYKSERICECWFYFETAVWN